MTNESYGSAPNPPSAIHISLLDALQWLLFASLFLWVAVCTWAILFWRTNLQESSFIPIAFATLVSTLLAILPALLCVVQNASRRRQHNRLLNLSPSPLAGTVFYRAAVNSIDANRLVVDKDYSFPIVLLVFVYFLGFMAILFGFTQPQYLRIPNVLLLGLRDGTDVSVLQSYQLQTFAVIAMAFFGSYVYTIGRLLDRINNNDLYPVSLYYYICRTIIACAVAGVLRHAITLLSVVSDKTLGNAVSDSAAPLLIIIGFAVGFAPDQFILVVTRKAFQAVKTWATREDPGDEPPRPTALPLLMIDDLTREKIDRLNELGIDSAQVLGKQNPFLLLPRLPFDVSLLVDWIAQAQLYVLVKEAGLAKLRAKFVRDVFDFYIRLSNDESRAAICDELGIQESVGKVLCEQLDGDASFMRLKETKNALLPAAPT